MHTSGITVDESVAAEFAAAKADPSVLYLQYRIINDRFQRTGTGKRTASRSADFLALQSALSPSEPSFLVAHPAPLSSSSSADKWLLLFFMPAAASVRDRMIYSSSTSALRDGLGSAAFLPATWNLTDRGHCSEEEWAEHGRQLSDADMMTSDEIAAKEAETSSSLAMSSSRVNAIVGLPVRLADGSMDRLRALKEAAGRSALLKLDGETEMLSVEEEGDWSFEDAAKKLPAGEPRYLLTNFQHQHNGQQEQAFILYYYCPESIKPKLKMFYSTCKSVVVRLLQDEAGLSISKSLEVSDRAEVNTALVMDALHPQETAKKAFKKPGRPGRGNARLIANSGE